MRNFIVMIKNNLNIMILKKPVFFVLSILIPIAIVVFMGMVMDSDPKAMNIGISGSETNLIYKNIADSIENEKNINLVKVEENELRNKIGEKSIDAGVIVSNDIYSKLSRGETDCVKIIGKEGDSTSDLINTVVTLEINNINRLIKVSNNNEKVFDELLNQYNKENIKVEKGVLSNKGKENEVAGIFVGFLIMFMFFKATLGAARINDDKFDKVYSRMFVAGIKVWQYYLGNIIGSLISLVIQIILVIIALSLFTEVNLGMSNLNMFIVLFLVAILAVSIGTFCVAITRSDQEAGIVSNILIMALLMLGGCFVPVMLFPDFINRISKMLPTRWAMDMITELQNGRDISELWKNILIILLFSIAFFLLAAYKTKHSEKSINI
ncbi:ABC transporter permease [Clostridium sp.]|uniref:ABC transporter permease n=1 Tax=Clostridium sp. TaxID=1506 RepID=UPI002FC98D47